MESKVSSALPTEEKPDIQETKQKEEKSLTPEIIKKIYEKGRLYIMTTIISLGMFQVDKSGSEQNFDYFISKFKNIPKEKSHEVYDDLNKILSPEEFSIYCENDNDSLISNSVLDNKFREILVKLSSKFIFKSDDLFIDFSEKKEEEQNQKQLYKIDTEDSWKKIDEILKEFPSGYKPEISSIPYSHIEYLNDPVYFKALKRLASIKMTRDVAYCNNNNIKKIATDDDLFIILEKFNSLGPEFSAGIIDRFFESGTKPEYLDEEQWQKKLNFRNDFEHFLQSNPNAKIFEYGKGSKFESNGIINLMDDSSGRYIQFFEDKNNQKSIEFLRSIGYDFQSMYFLIRSNYENMVNEPEFLDALNELSVINRRGDSYSVWFHLLSKYDSYYNLDTKDGFEDLAHDLKRAKYKLGNSSVDFYKVRDKLEEITDKHTKNSNEIIKENVFEPLVADMDTSYQHWDEFLKDPALEIITKLKYQNNIPKYLDTLDYFSKIDWMMRVARNMYIANTPITPEDFEKTFYETVSIRMDKELIEKSLFKNRNVAFFAHNERYGDDKKDKLTKYKLQNKGKNCFGKAEAMDAISKQQPDNLNIFRANNTSESLINTKKLFLEYIINNSNLTVVVDAHGNENAIYLTNGLPKSQELKNSVPTEGSDCVTFEEIANAIEERYDKNIKDVPIFIMTSCYNQNFIRNLCEKIIEINSQKKKDIQLPIISGDAEYGQYAYSTESEFGNDFFDMILKNKSNSRIKDIIQIENGTLTTNISLFVPFTKESKDINSKKIKQKIFYQITQHGGTPLNKTLALQYAEGLLSNTINDKTASYWEYTNKDLAHEIRKTIEDYNIELVS